MLVIILFWRRIAERRIRKAGSAGKRPVTTTQAVDFRNDAVLDAEPGAVGVVVGASAA